MIWHSSTPEQVIQQFGTDPERGLSSDAADTVRAKAGENRLSASAPLSVWDIIRQQAAHYHTWLIVLAVLLAYIFTALYDPVHRSIPLWTVPVYLLHFFTQVLVTVRNQRIAAKLSAKASPRVYVRRDGKIKRIDATLVVPGDILLLGPGEYIAADGRLISTADFHVDETFVFGKNESIEKLAYRQFDNITSMEDRSNMVYCGSHVLSGRATAIVTETGMQTELAKSIYGYEQQGNADQKLKERFERIGRKAGRILLLFCVLVYLLQVVFNPQKDMPFIQLLANSLINTCALLICVLPEGLPLIVATAMTSVSSELLKHKVLVKKADAFDRLNNVTVICADKTGILTQNQMRVKELFTGDDVIPVDQVYGQVPAVNLLRMAALCTYQTNEDTDSVFYNDPTETAITDCCFATLGCGRDDFFSRYPRLCKIDFTAQRKCMTSVNMINEKPIAVVKGSPEYVLDRCDPAIREKVVQMVDHYTAQSMRVIAVAYRILNEIPANPTVEQLENHLTFVGLIALSNPLQSNIVSQLAACAESGIKTVMLTGDHAVTARSTARRLGILKDDSQVVTGNEIHRLNDDELTALIGTATVFADLMPGDKQRIVSLLQASGEYVAVTGGSVNDAPALREASIGFALGDGGTDVARGAADIVLKDNSFGSIAHTISSARRLFTTLRKILSYLLSSNVAEGLCVLIALCVMRVFPLPAVALLLVNLLTDYFPVAALLVRGTSVDKRLNGREADSKKLFTKTTVIRMIVQAAAMCLTSLLCMSFADSPDQRPTLLFVALVLTQLFNTVTMQSESLLIRPFKNKWFYILLTFCLLPVMLVSLTGFATHLGLSVIRFAQLGRCLLMALIPLIVGELTKLFARA